MSGSGPAADAPCHVLFLCVGNSARSIIAEAILNRDGARRFRAFSAGSEPAGSVNPHALALLRARGCATAELRSKDWSEFTRTGAPRIDIVITVCDAAAGTCPVWPGHPASAHWGMPDPAAATGTPAEIAAAFERTFRTLDRRIARLRELPIAALDGAALRAALAAIGVDGGT